MHTILLPAALVAAGSLVMVGNLIFFFKFVRRMKGIHLHSHNGTFALLILYFLLLFFFLCGYIAVEVSFFLPSIEINNTLLGMIFLGGSIFVAIGLRMQTALSSTVQRSNLEILQALVNAVEARDPNLNGHSQHVARLTMLIYQYMPRKYRMKVDSDSLEYAAMLHDIGKLGVREDILNKPAALNDEEWTEMKKHPLIGKSILEGLEHFKPIAEWVLYHHERCDGKGYMGLAHHQIPIASRIIAVADTFSAITMSRSYRGAKSTSEAVQILLECRGTQLDRVFVDAFLRIPREKVDACMPHISEPHVLAAEPPVL